MRYLEDFTVGERIPAPKAIDLDEAAIISFARQHDPQPMHIDAEAAKDGPLKGLSASGWQTTAVVMRMIVDADLFDGGPVLGLGVDEIRWPNPVRPGDSIHAELEVVSITPSRSKPTHGVIRMRVKAWNQKQELVLSMFPNLWVPRREPV